MPKTDHSEAACHGWSLIWILGSCLGLDTCRGTFVAYVLLQVWGRNGNCHLFPTLDYQICIWDCLKSMCSSQDQAPPSGGGRISLPKISDQLCHNRTEFNLHVQLPQPSHHNENFVSLWVTMSWLLVEGGCWISWISKISSTNNHIFLRKDLTYLLYEYIKCRLLNHRVDNNIDF